ncbi:hypothetical protein [Actinomadura rupiterrae]|uniref:hypothetical protein n=1 Tax=Actinomadura rupiterrae TaxID=559627 RepID=UPI0020A38534|nr:hypothetical protein [Actinomadura rupiterrae]MCP2342987.1 hypothetical protein [Actinomadura rupiterrae]
MSATRIARLVPAGFLCEHSHNKSRVFAQVHVPNGPSALRAVFTCTDAALAQRAAEILTHACINGPGTTVHAEAERISAALPAAPSASFRKALDQALKREWQLSDTVDVPTYEALSSRYTADSTLSDSASSGPHGQAPRNARLSEFPGKVVRITKLLELHVYDEKQLLSAARAQGWFPLDVEEREEDDPKDVVGAVMHLLSHLGTPGTDNVTEQDIGQLLRPSAGDEVTDWSPVPITANFSAGWLARPAPPGRPDFTKLFPLKSECDCGVEDCDECGSWKLTPRTADVLQASLEILADQAFNDVQAHGDQPVSRQDEWSLFAELPPHTWEQNATWRRQVARAFDDLADEIEQGQWPEPRCPAEEMALDLAIRHAPVQLEILEEMADDDVAWGKQHHALPKHQGDYDWIGCAGIFFEDDDYLNTPAEDWFFPFGGFEPRDPKRGFRR